MIEAIHALLDEMKVSWEKNILNIEKKPKKPKKSIVLKKSKKK